MKGKCLQGKGDVWEEGGGEDLGMHILVLLHEDMRD